MPKSPESPTPDADELRRVLEQVLRFVDITRDLERNQDDAAFAKSDGTIHYVFDENVFEMFVHPWRNKGYTATFYSQFWYRHARSADRDGWFAIPAQSALIASEYLLSGQLPGQRDGLLHLTEWHQWELRERIDALTEYQRAQIAQSTQAMRRRSDTSFDNQPFLKEDVEFLRTQDEWSQKAIDRFIVSRTTANILAADLVLEPIEQLARLVNGPIRDRFADLNGTFEVPPTEFDIIAANTRAWLGRFVKEQERPKRKFSRHHGALLNDAKSLALVQWAADRCIGTNRRVVFVTGDGLVFDAYRRWHSSVAPGSAEYLKPFALRRIVQYAPIFNMNDGIGDISNAEQLFDLTRQAVEVTLLPFNLSQMGVRSERKELVNRGREYLALKLVDAEDLVADSEIGFFARRLTKAWLDESWQRLNDMRDLWQRTERAAIGSMYESILPRLNRSQKLFAEVLAEAGAADIGPALTRYVDDLLNQIVEDSFQLWLPLASRFIDSELLGAVKGIWPRRSRLQILVRLDVPWGERSTDLASLLERWARGEQPIEQMFSLDVDSGIVERPELVFAVAATLALILGAWSNADRFAELARKASEEEGREASCPLSERYEFVYLHAVAKRFRIAEFGPTANDGVHIAISKIRAIASRLLAECIDYHHQPADGQRPQPLREIRARAERASINIFFSATAALARNSALRRKLIAAEEVAAALGEAEQDLAASLELEKVFEAEVLHDDERSRRYSRLQRQILSNVAACAVVRRVLFDRPLLAALATPALAARSAALLDREGDSLPEVVRSDLLMFIYLVGRQTDPSLEISSLLRKRTGWPNTLSLDRARLDATATWVKKELAKRAAFQPN